MSGLHLPRRMLVPRPPRVSAPVAYGFAIVVTLIIFALQHELIPIVSLVPFILSFLAVFLAAWVGGRGPGFVSIALAAALVDYHFLPPENAWSTSPRALILVGLFIVVSTVVNMLCGALRDAVADAERGARHLRYQLDLNAGISQNAAEAIFVTDEAGRVTFANREAERLFGFSREELTGQVLHDRVHHHHPDGRPFPANECRLALINVGETTIRDVWETFFRKDGLAVSVSCSSAPLDIEGRRTGAVLIARDVSERKRAEEALERERSLLTSVMRATDVMLVYLDPDFNFVWVNDAYAATCNYRPEEMVGKNHFALYPHAENESIFRRVRDTGEPVFYKDKPFEFPDQPEREVTYWDWSLVPVKDGAGKVQGLVFSLRETTKFKKAEVARRESDVKFRALFENLLDGYAYCRMFFDDGGRPEDFVYLEVNAAFTRLTGLRDVVGKRVTEVIPGVRESAPGLMETYGRVASTGHPERFEFNFEPLGMWLEISVYSPQQNHFVAVFDDITGRKTVEVEREKLVATLRETDRRKSEFLAMLSHELRNPLAPIRNSLYILDRAAPGGEQARRAQSVIDRQVAHLTRLVDDLLDLTRISRGKVQLRRESLDFADVMRRAVEDHRSVFVANKLDLEVSIPDCEVRVYGDRTRIAQAIGNLLNNASKFTPAGGTVSVLVETSERLGQAIARVRDTGAGIAPDVLPRLFEPFIQADTTLDRSKGGLGLGLALVKGLVEMHGGTVSVSSDGLGKGAEFTIRIPLEDGFAGAENSGPRVARAHPA